MPRTYIEGSVVRIDSLLVNVDGRIVEDELDVMLTITDPDGTEDVRTAAEIEQTYPGRWWVHVNVSEVGSWFYVWRWTGTVQAVTEGRFNVRATVP